MREIALTPLELLRAGEWGLVTDVCGQVGLVARLGELGLRPGARVRMLSPGSPCLFQIGQSRLSLRTEASCQVLVRPLPSEATGDL
ncbi:MAG: ferrous iron transport protein A [Gemmataceae bacterium]